MTILLNSKIRSNLLAFLFAHQDDMYYVRELANLTGEDAGNLSRELRKLENEGLLLSRNKGHVKFYSLNKSYPLYSDLKNILLKTKGVQGVLKKLILTYDGIKSAFIYGSFAEGVEKKTSDIDLILVGKFNRDKFTRELRKIELKLGREINFTFYGKEEFDKERKKTGGFLSVVLKSKIVLLKGSVDDR